MPKGRILVVDDQLYFRVYLEDLLRQQGYEVRTASGAGEALHLIEREDFDVVLTDLVMPGVHGAEFVQQLKERLPRQEIVVVSSVGDVRTAVEAMKVGATDYLLKPIDAAVLERCLEGIRERRRMSEEHARLMAENIEFLGAFSLYERALGLFGTLSVEPLADRIVEGLCLETGAHGGVLWLASCEDPGRLRLAGARGLVRVDDEPQELVVGELPYALVPLRERGRDSLVVAPPGAPEAPTAPDGEGDEDGAAGGPLYVAIRHAGDLLGIARLTDKLEGDAFGDSERAAAERFAGFASQAVANALQHEGLERRSFRDPVTKAYTRVYLEDVARNEIQKASRFGRTFSLLGIQIDGLAALRAELPQTELSRWLEGVAVAIGRGLRSSDLLAAESESRFCLFLPETGPLGAAVLKRRMRSALERGPELAELDAELRPELLLATASFPADATQVDGLWRILEARLEEDRGSLIRNLGLRAAPFRDAMAALLERTHEGRPETAEQMTRFLLAEVAQRPHERGMLFVAPGAGLAGALRDGLEAVRGLTPRTDIVVVADRSAAPVPGLPVTWVSPIRAGTQAPFIVYYAEGPCYALVRGEAQGDAAPMYHTSERAVVEHLAFQLGRDLGIPIGE